MQEHTQQQDLLHAGAYTAAGSPACRTIQQQDLLHAPCRSMHSSNIFCMQEHTQQQALLHAGAYTAVGPSACRSIHIAQSPLPKVLELRLGANALF